MGKEIEILPESWADIDGAHRHGEERERPTCRDLRMIVTVAFPECWYRIIRDSKIFLHFPVSTVTIWERPKTESRPSKHFKGQQSHPFLSSLTHHFQSFKPKSDGWSPTPVLKFLPLLPVSPGRSQVPSLSNTGPSSLIDSTCSVFLYNLGFNNSIFFSHVRQDLLYHCVFPHTWKPTPFCPYLVHYYALSHPIVPSFCTNAQHCHPTPASLPGLLLETSTHKRLEVLLIYV